MGGAIAVFGLGSLRSLARPRGSTQSDVEDVPDPRVRILYWCENCGAEVLVAHRGNGHGFRHCGEQMHKREEILRELS